MKLNHPTLPDRSKNVPDEIAEKWLENGWTEAEADVEAAADESDDVEGDLDDDADTDA